jgi:hypothetical protein
MSPGTLTLAMLTLTLGANPSDDVVYLNSRNIQIPIFIQADKRDKIKELLLFTSTDQGATWNQVAVATPDKDSFVFYAPSDGLYWFNFTVVDAQGKRVPDIYQTPPRQKVLVDTVKPNIRLTTAERQGDEIAVGWEIQELNPDHSSLKLEYRTTDAAQWAWTAVNAAGALTGQARFRPASNAAVSVRLQMLDQAKNLGSAQTDIPAKAVQALPTAVPISAVPGPSNTGPASAANPGSSYSTVGASTVPNSAWGPAANTTPVLSPPSMASGERVPPVQPASLSQADSRNLPERTLPVQAAPSGNGYSLETAARFTTPAGSYSSSSPPAAGARWPVTAIVPLQLTNNPQVSLEYQISRTGPSGVGSVELYLTEDDGRTWRRYADDPDLTSPITATLPGEGVFGLRLIVTSKAGLGHRPPQSGDLPQMRVEVDTTPPVVKLFYPQADAHRREVLVLTWTASDRNLAPNPITLQWAERPDSTWHTIAADLTNSGRYTWQLTPNLPYRVYLRVIARDSAGNTGIDETSEPVLIDLHEPEGQLIGITGTVRK